MQSTAYILISIISLAVIALIIVIRQKQIWGEEKDDYGQTPEELTSKTDEQTDKQQRIKTLVSIGLGVMVAGGFLAYLIMRKQVGGEEADREGLSIAVFVPVWLAAMIPILAGKKKKEQLKPSQQKLIFISVILTILLVLATLLFWGLNSH
jgi:cytochrome bd-type quinol oxidase subunit 2